MFVDLTQFRGVLDRVAPAAGNTGVTANVLLVATDGTLTATCTDYDVSATASCPCDGDLSALVPVAALAKVVRAMPGPRLELTAGNGAQLHVGVGRSRMMLCGFDADQFPEVEWPSGDGAAVDSGALDLALTTVATAVGQDDSRPALCGVLFERDGERLRLVTTDGHRLHTTTTPVALPSSWTPAILHRRALAVLRSVLDGGATVEIAAVGRDLVFRCGGAMVKARQIEANFPDYNKVIPARSDKTCTLPVAATLEALARATVFAKGEAIVRLTFGDTLEFDCKTLDVGDGHDEVPIDAWTGDVGTVSLSPRYLADALRACGGSDVDFGWGDAVSPCTVRGAQTVCVLMPCRI